MFLRVSKRPIDLVNLVYFRYIKKEDVLSTLIPIQDALRNRLKLNEDDKEQSPINLKEIE